MDEMFRDHAWRRKEAGASNEQILAELQSMGAKKSDILKLLQEFEKPQRHPGQAMSVPPWVAVVMCLLLLIPIPILALMGREVVGAGLFFLGLVFYIFGYWWIVISAFCSSPIWGLFCLFCNGHCIYIIIAAVSDGIEAIWKQALCYFGGFALMVIGIMIAPEGVQEVLRELNQR